MIESGRLEGTSGCLWFNSLLKVGLIPNSDQVSQGFIQLCLEKVQGQRLYNIPEQPAPMLDCPW